MIDGVSEVSTENIEKYFDDSPIRFHLFEYLNEIIFNRLELKENKTRLRILLNSTFCLYSVNLMCKLSQHIGIRPINEKNRTISY